MPDVVLVDAVGRRRSDVTLPGYSPAARRITGDEIPRRPARVEEIVAVMRAAWDDRYGLRVRAAIAVLWRGGLRLSGALALSETDVDPRRGAVLTTQAAPEARGRLRLSKRRSRHERTRLTRAAIRPRHRPTRMPGAP
jgi:integrase